jgi:hypothetical protein
MKIDSIYDLCYLSIKNKIYENFKKKVKKEFEIKVEPKPKHLPKYVEKYCHVYSWIVSDVFDYEMVPVIILDHEEKSVLSHFILKIDDVYYDPALKEEERNKISYYTTDSLNEVIATSGNPESMLLKLKYINIFLIDKVLNKTPYKLLWKLIPKSKKINYI